MIRLVLDTTAVTAYAAGSIHVGELLAEVQDEGAGYACPNLCLAEAARDVDPALLDVLAKDATVHVALPDWRDLGLDARLYGTVVRALVADLARRYRAYVVTGDPEAYPGLPTVEV